MCVCMYVSQPVVSCKRGCVPLVVSTPRFPRWCACEALGLSRDSSDPTVLGFYSKVRLRDWAQGPLRWPGQQGRLDQDRVRHPRGRRREDLRARPLGRRLKGQEPRHPGRGACERESMWVCLCVCVCDNQQHTFYLYAARVNLWDALKGQEPRHPGRGVCLSVGLRG